MSSPRRELPQRLDLGHLLFDLSSHRTQFRNTETTFWILIAAGVTEAEAYPGCFLHSPARSVWLAFWHLLENLGCPTGLGMCTGPLPRVPRKCELATSPWLFGVGNITVNFPWKWRSQILANLKQRLVQLFFGFKGSAYKSEEILSGSKFCSQKPLWNYYSYYRQ